MHIQTDKISFGASRLNIVAMADNHGDILGIPQIIKTIKERKEDMFEHKDDASTKNVLAIAGDYFMNPAGMGLLTSPSKTLGDIQYSFLNKMIYEVKKSFNNVQNFSTIYTPGNHCYGGGDDWLYNKMYSRPVTTLVSNINLDKSPYVAKLMGRFKNITTKSIYELTDDKNPDIKNHVLFLGLTIPSSYYNLTSLKYTKFYDHTTKNDAAIEEHDLQETIQVLNNEIKQFKEQYPKSAVVMLAHTGNRISNIIARNVDDINVILNAHDHKDFSTIVGNTQIFSLGQNNQFLRSINVIFDDDGKLSIIKNQKYETAQYRNEALKDKSLISFVNKLLAKDLVPLLTFDESDDDINQLVYSNDIRCKNNILANYITSAIKSAAKKKYPELEIVGIPSTIIRSGLKGDNERNTFNNIDLLNMFKGVDESISGIQIGNISGKELVRLILENVVNNLKSPTRNALIQWSDVQVNKTLIGRLMLERHNLEDYAVAVKIKNSKTRKFEQVDLERNYTVMLADKYLYKCSRRIKTPAKIISKFKHIPESYPELFEQYIDSIDGNVKITNKRKEKRII